MYKIIFSVLLLTYYSVTHVKAQTPIQKSLQGYIDPFSGDFRYQVPLLTLSGPNGESFPLVLTYQGGGIPMNADAGWIGLGWNLSIGEIQRGKNGMPDDVKEAKFTNYNYTPSIGETNEDSLRYFGPVYFRDFPYSEINPSSPAACQPVMDVYQTDRLSTAGDLPFQFPDYDDYYVSAPGLHGKMTMALFEYASLYHKQTTDYNSGKNPQSDILGYQKAFTKKPQFYFEDEPATQVLAPYFHDFNWHNLHNAQCVNGACEGYLQPPGMLSQSSTYDDEYYGDYLLDNTSTPPTSYRKGVYFTEYFTNSEINTFYSSASFPDNFLDFQANLSSTTRNSTDFEADGVGMIRITDPNGMTYHYALPVYSMDEISRTFPLDQYLNPDTSRYNRISQPAKYASSWKLTAITGYDYEDSNNNHYPDQGDQGYWIAFDYSLWTDSFHWRSPFYNFNYNSVHQRYPDKYEPHLTEQVYEEGGSTSEGKTQLYYINWIKTSSQTIYFVKDIRLDGHSLKNSSNEKTPKLYLRKILLIDNDDITSSWFETSSTDLASSDYSGLANTTEDRTTVNWTQYSANKSAIDAKVLKAVELTHDYSLCKKLDNNIKNSFNTTIVTQKQTGGPFRFLVETKNASSFSTTDLSNSGKLTLKELDFYENAHENVSPGYLFGYGGTDNHNPDFDHEKHDYFGLYKHTFDTDIKGGYLTSDDIEYVDAWQLTKVTLPIGGELLIEYEPDQYEGVIYDFNSSQPGPVRRVFRLQEVYNSPKSITVNDEDFGKIAGQSIERATLFFTHSSNSVMFVDGTAKLSYISNTNFAVTGGVSAASYASPCTNCIGDFAGSTAYISFTVPFAYGGGTRVKNIKLREPVINEEYSLAVTYENGIATAEPDPYSYGGLNGNVVGNIAAKAQLFLTNYSGDRHSLPPAVGYSKIKYNLIGSSGNSLGGTEMNMINYFDTYARQGARATKLNYDAMGTDVLSVNIYDVVLVRENTSRFGKPISVETFDSHGITISKKEYKYSNSVVNKEPAVEEVFYRQLHTTGEVGDEPYYDQDASEGFNFYTVLYKIKERSFITEEITYEDGVKIRRQIQKRDPLTGAASKTQVTNNSTIDIIEYAWPAFRNYSTLGSRFENSANLNILFAPQTQKLYTGNILSGAYSKWTNNQYEWKYDNTLGRYKPVSSTTFWHPDQNYIFNGDTDSLNWQRSMRITLIGERNTILEVKDAKDYYAADKFGYNNQFNIASAVNSNYSSFTHAGFEAITVADPNGTPKNFADGDVLIDGCTRIAPVLTDPIQTHTGNYYLSIPQGAAAVYSANLFDETLTGGEVIERGIQKGRKYKASVWVHSSSHADATLTVKLAGSSTTTVSDVKSSSGGVVIGNWQLLSVEIELPSGFTSGTDPLGDFQVKLTSSGGTAYFDDLRLQPVDANVSATLFDERMGLVTYEIDNNNFYIRYEYDAARSVKAVYKETHLGEKKIASTSYKFARD